VTLLTFAVLFNAFGAAINMSLGQRAMALINAFCAAACLVVIAVMLSVAP